MNLFIFYVFVFWKEQEKQEQYNQSESNLIPKNIHHFFCENIPPRERERGRKKDSAFRENGRALHQASASITVFIYTYISIAQD